MSDTIELAAPGRPLGAYTRPKGGSGWRDWITTVDHKKIGILYGATAMFFFGVGGLEALLMRLQLATPDGTVLGANFDSGPEVRELPMPERFRPFDDDRDGRLMAFRLLLQRFIQGVESGTSPGPNFYDGFRCQQVLDAVRDSSGSDGWVQLER